jgi:hypothetical protein
MLQDGKADRFVKDFVYQWLDLEKLTLIEPDVSIFTVDEFDLVRDQIKEEPVEFFNEVLSSNLSLLNFIDSDFVMITPELNYVNRSKDIRSQSRASAPGQAKSHRSITGPKRLLPNSPK